MALGSLQMAHYGNPSIDQEHTKHAAHLAGHRCMGVELHFSVISHLVLWQVDRISVARALAFLLHFPSFELDDFLGINMVWQRAYVLALRMLSTANQQQI